MNELALFAGAGGGILGGILNGWRTVCAVEINDYCRRVLMQRQDDGILEPFPIWDDITTFDGRPWAGCVDIVTGGFPCQDISAAGRGAGITGERSGLWSEMARVIGEVRPRYVLVENSPMLTLRGLDRVLGDLSALGFDAEWGVISAAHTGAPHKRERIWIVANARCWVEPKPSDTKQVLVEWNSEKRTANPLGGSSGFNRKKDVAHHPQHGRGSGRAGRPDPGHPRQSEQSLPYVANGHGHAIQGLEQKPQPSRQGRQTGLHRRARGFPAWPADPADAAESPVGRVAHGVAARVDRLKALGNGQVPRVVAAAFSTLTVNPVNPVHPVPKTSDLFDEAAA